MDQIKEIRKRKELGANNFSNFCLFAMLADFTFVCEFGLFSQHSEIHTVLLHRRKFYGKGHVLVTVV
jgi:alkyl hydroperoxide reductase subunit AhpC